MNNFIIVVLDGVGVGELPDAAEYNDLGTNTLGNIAKKLGGISLPNLQKLGLGNIIPIKGVTPSNSPIASYGKCQEISKGKDSTTGHWEIAGLEVTINFPYYYEGFPNSIIEKFITLNNVPGILGNKAASGTEIIKELGEEHVKTGKPIVYTSADSVFQIAAHEEIIPLPQLYKICEVTRTKILIDNDSVGRVIARPFIGEPGNFTRTTNRKDYSIDPPEDTILDVLKMNNITTIAIGKINDLFSHRGITNPIKSKSNSEGLTKTIELIKDSNNSFIFTNLVDFDVYFGHRNDTKGFYGALKEFDDRLPALLDSLHETDHIIFTADHGNDPTLSSTDHSREFIPLLYFNKNKSATNLGTRETFSDIAKTVATFFDVQNKLKGKSFLNN